MKARPENKVYGIITDKIVNLLEGGVIPWEQKWDNQLPQNFVSKHQYTGFNFFYLYVMAIEKSYNAPYWLTFKQIQDAKGKLKPDQYKRGEIVIFYKMNTWVDKNELDEKGQPKVKAYPILRFYTVYNIEQTEGIDWKSSLRKNNPIEACEAIVKNYKDCPTITHAVGVPHYTLELDNITLPDLSIYEEPQYYYKTLFHELTHSTGHEKRLGRFKPEDSVSFGSEDYSKEELIAELGSAFLCADTGISNEQTQGHSASYIKGWLKALKNDERLIVEASGKAQKAVDYVKGVKTIK